MSGGTSDDSPPTGRQDYLQWQLEEISLTSTSIVDETDRQDSEEQRSAEHTNIPDVVTTREVQVMMQQQSHDQKGENPLDAIGSWFQGIGKGGVRNSPPDEPQAREGQLGERKDIENREPCFNPSETSQADPASTESQDVTENTVEIQDSSKDNPFVGTVEGSDASDIHQKIRVLFGHTINESERTSKEVASKKGRIESKVMEKHQGAFFGNRQRNSRDELGDSLSGPSDVDESLKKQGGVRQRISRLFNKQRRILFSTFLVVLISMILLVPSMNKEMLTAGLFNQRLAPVETFLQADVIPHPLYQGHLFPSGQINVHFDVDNHFLVHFGVAGVEQNCERCAWSIVEGDSCHDVSKLGDIPYYDRMDPAFANNQNPFSTCSYFSTQDGRSDTTHKVYSGYNFHQNQNHAIVLNDSNETPLACGILKRQGYPLTSPKLSANMMNLPSNNSSTTIQGEVRIDVYPDHVFYLNFESLSGLPPECSKCAIAIHSGASCADPLEDHFWNSDKLFSDPWVVMTATAATDGGGVDDGYKNNGAFYDSDSNGTCTDRHGFYFYNGFGHDDHVDRLVIVYDSNSVPIGCGTLQLHSASHFIWQATEAAIHSGMQAGTVIHDSPTDASDMIPVGVQIVNDIDHH